MAKSKAKKKREKLIREGRMNPEINRGSWNGICPITKKTPTLVEKKRKLENKHKKWNPFFDADERGSIFYLLLKPKYFKSFVTNICYSND
jgi:hypothetical protein